MYMPGERQADHVADRDSRVQRAGHLRVLVAEEEASPTAMMTPTIGWRWIAVAGV